MIKCTTSDGKDFDFHVLDPSPAKGKNTYVVNRETGRRFLVKKYNAYTKEVRLQNDKGLIFSTIFNKDSYHKYKVEYSVERD